MLVTTARSCQSERLLPKLSPPRPSFASRGGLSHCAATGPVSRHDRITTCLNMVSLSHRDEGGRCDATQPCAIPQRVTVGPLARRAITDMHGPGAQGTIGEALHGPCHV